jgi:hypothetical protein
MTLPERKTSFRKPRRWKSRGPRSAIHRMVDVLKAAYPSKEPEDLQAIRAFYWWEKAVPKRVLENVRPVRYGRGILTVHAKNSVWASELTFLEPQILAALQKRAPEARVKKLVVRVGVLPPRPLPIRTIERKPPPIPLKDLPEELARELASVRHDDLRLEIERAARTGLGTRPKP